MDTFTKEIISLIEKYNYQDFIQIRLNKTNDLDQEISLYDSPRSIFNYKKDKDIDNTINRFEKDLGSLIIKHSISNSIKFCYYFQVSQDKKYYRVLKASDNNFEFINLTPKQK